MDSAVFILNNKSPPIILDCNPVASSIFGYKKQEMLDKTTEFLHESKKTLLEFQDILYPFIEKQGYLSFFEFKMKRKNMKRKCSYCKIIFSFKTKDLKLSKNQKKNIEYTTYIISPSEKRKVFSNTNPIKLGRYMNKKNLFLCFIFLLIYHKSLKLPN